jgi:hypothetical protein
VNEKPLFGLMLSLTLSLAACTGELNAQTQAAEKTKPADTYTPPKSFMLSIVGYNYTDRYIDSFSVNGRGGGNLDISKEGLGGGSAVCCVSWTEGSKLPLKVTVKWVAAYCMRRITNSANETRDWRESVWHIADIEFKGPVPESPRNFEVHFYPDGGIDVAITEKGSQNRLNLPSTPTGYIRPGVKLNDPKCPADYDNFRASMYPKRVDATLRSPK